MTAEVVDRVRRSSRYRDVDRSLLARFAGEEVVRARNTEEAVKRVKRRLHQAIGAFRGAAQSDALASAWSGDLSAPAFRRACAEALRGHASTRERLAHLDAFYPGIWAVTGLPARVLDIGCGLNPLTLPWMAVAPDATYVASEVDRRPLGMVGAFLELIGQPHVIEVRDVVSAPPSLGADVALLLKLVTTLDRQDPHAAARLIAALRVRHAVVSFARHSLGGRGKGMERAYRARLERLVADVDRVEAVTEASIANELVFVLTLHAADG